MRRLICDKTPDQRLKNFPRSQRISGPPFAPRGMALEYHRGVSLSSAMRASSSQPMRLRRRRKLFFGAEVS